MKKQLLFFVLFLIVSTVNAQFGTQQIIEILDWTLLSSEYADIDGDGDMDVIAISWGDGPSQFGQDVKIAWYENTNGQGAFGSEQTIDFINGNETVVYTDDIDGDGDLDMISIDGRNKSYL